MKCHLQQCESWELMLSKVSQTEKDKYYMMSLICGVLKKKTNEINIQTWIRLTDRKKKEVWSPKGRGEKQIRSMGLTDIKYHM